MADLVSLIERYPSSTADGIHFPGLHPEVIAPVFEYRDRLDRRLNRDAAVAICRAMQHVAEPVAWRRPI
jgi:hypothetical protein